MTRAFALAAFVFAASAWADDDDLIGAPPHESEVFAQPALFAGPKPLSRLPILGCDWEPDPSEWGVGSLFNEDDPSEREPEPRYFFFHPEHEPLKIKVEDLTADGPGYLNGIGSPGRCWEITSDTAFGYRRVLTQRLEIARALQLRKNLSAVIRMRAGADGDTTTRLYALQGVAPSFGLRHQPPLGGFAIEFGIRMVIGWGGPDDSEPRAQKLALDATTTSGVGSDALWLPFSSTGFQLYLEIQSRTRLLSFPFMAFMLGVRYGAEGSLGSLAVRTWIGTQPAFVSNMYLEPYLALHSFDRKTLRMTLGVHVDASMSSIWPGEAVFPVVVNGFWTWSPSQWLVLRLFAGVGGSLGLALGGIEPLRMQYGARVQVYLP